MFCDYCRRLFELRQKAEKYEPPQKAGLGGVVSSTSAAQQQLKQTQYLKDEREWMTGSVKADLDRRRGGDVTAPRPEIDVYEDAQDLFTPRLLWWKIPIPKQGLNDGYSHAPGANCTVCKMIFSNIAPSLIDVLIKKNGQGENALAFVYQLRSVLGSKKMMASNEAVLSIWLEVGKELLPMVKLQVMRRVHNPLYLTYGHVGSTNTGSDEALDLATSWIRDCNLNHSRCSVSRTRDRQLPTRLIDVGSVQENRKPHLWIPKPGNNIIQYIALSYRWSSSPKVTLTKGSSASLCKEIPMELLPQSNQDAIHIARYLGIQYLWIDALCIMQDLDDPSDWLKESAQMEIIYKFAYVTISASQASTGEGGCFAAHQPLEARLTTSRRVTASEKERVQRRTELAKRLIVECIESLAADFPSRIVETPEPSEVYTEETGGCQNFDGSSTPPIKPISTSMLTPEEAMLEMVVRCHLQLRPSSTAQILYEELGHIQESREQAAPTLHGHCGSQTLSVHRSASSLTVSTKMTGQFDFSGVKGIEFAELSRCFLEVEQWRKSNFRIKGPYVHQGMFPPDSLMAKFASFSLDDTSLLSLSELSEEKILRKKIAESPTNESLHRKYQQIRDLQHQRASVRDERKSEIIIRTLQTDLWATEVDASPLSRRAWTLQERLLSTRVLHFTQSQIFWECECSKACETWPQPEPRKNSWIGYEYIPSAKRTTSHPLSGVTLKPLEAHWEEIVELYTNASLTREEDKLVAISSLAKSIQKKRKDQYLAGLWRRTILRDLLFCVETPQKLVERQYRAPSWSWASINGKVNFMCKKAQQVNSASNISSIWTVGIDGERASTGQIQDGSFTISTPVCQPLRQEKIGTSYRLIFIDETSDLDTSAEYFPDTKMAGFPAKAICIPIAYYKILDGVENVRGTWLAGLVLCPTGDAHDEFLRLGTFRMGEEGGMSLFDGMEWRSITVV